MKNKIIIISVLVVMIFIADRVLFKEVEEEQVFCTADAMMCPDGSYVGRTGPDCKFAECPAIKNTDTAKLSQKILNNGVYITPIEVVSDSRCPEDVTCIWAGEVKLKVRLEQGSSSEEISITSNTSTRFANKKITLTNISPNTNSKKTVEPSDYEFQFLVE